MVEAEVNLVHFTATDVRLEVIANTDGQIRGLRELIEARGGLAGINGGYFDANLDPVGLLISNDRVVHGLQKAKLLSGIFYVKNGRPWLAREPGFSRSKGIQQADPMRSISSGWRPGRERLGQPAGCGTNICLFVRGLVWGFGICRSVTLEDMGEILARTTLLPDHQIIRALNFDGGSSSTFYARADGRTIFSEQRPVVSNYLVVKLNS